MSRPTTTTDRSRAAAITRTLRARYPQHAAVFRTTVDTSGGLPYLTVVVPTHLARAGGDQAEALRAAVAEVVGRELTTGGAQSIRGGSPRTRVRFDISTRPYITPGTPVRFTAGNIGLMADVYATRFEREAVGAGDTGRYARPATHLPEPDWHVIDVNVDGRDLVAVVHRSMFAPVVDEPAARPVVLVATPVPGMPPARAEVWEDREGERNLQVVYCDSRTSARVARRRILGLACTDCDTVATVDRQPAGGTPEGKPGPKCDRHAGPARTTLGRPDEPADAAAPEDPDLLSLVDELAARNPDPTSRDQLDHDLPSTHRTTGSTR
jgi:hypothetical protein